VTTFYDVIKFVSRKGVKTLSFFLFFANLAPLRENPTSFVKGWDEDYAFLKA
jgi:hypothetical protein